LGSAPPGSVKVATAPLRGVPAVALTMAGVPCTAGSDTATWKVADAD
jgi:hypothetical protein